MHHLNNPLLEFYRSLPHDSFRRITKHDPVQVREAFKRFGVFLPEWLTDYALSIGTGEHLARNWAVWQWAYSVPSPRAIKTLVDLSPLIEIGAGRGYWADLVRQAGGDILAFDIAPGQQGHDRPDWVTSADESPRSYGDVWKGGIEEIEWHPGRSLFLCWPPYKDPMAAKCLRKYAGQTVIYVGEYRGCTADGRFHEMLESEWEETLVVALPQWSGTHDTLYVYKRITPPPSSPSA